MSPCRSKTVWIAVALTLGALAKVTPLAAQTSPAITVADLRSRLDRIADDSMMGRETGSLGDFKTATYVALEFQRVGLKPAGENGGWFQQVPFWVGHSALRTIAVEGGGTLHVGTDFVAIPGFVNTRLDNVHTIYGGVLTDPTTWIDSAHAAGMLVVFDGNGAITAPRLRTVLNTAFNNRRF